MADGLVTAAVQVGGAAIAASLTKIRLHTADASASSGTGSLTTASDQTVTFSSSAGVITATANFTGGAASGAVHGWSVWAGSTYWGYFGRDTGDATFNAAGAYTANVTITGSSS